MTPVQFAGRCERSVAAKSSAIPSCARSCLAAFVGGGPELGKAVAGVGRDQGSSSADSCVEDPQQVAHLLKLEAQRLHPPDHVQPLHVGLGVETEPALAARAGHDQSDLLVVPDRAQRQSGPFGHLADLHVLAHNIPSALAVITHSGMSGSACCGPSTGRPAVGVPCGRGLRRLLDAYRNRLRRDVIIAVVAGGLGTESLDHRVSSGPAVARIST